MQTIYPHKNICKLSSYALSQEKLEEHRKNFEQPVKKWQNAKQQGCDDLFAKEHAGISRATFFRYKKKLQNLKRGILPPIKKPLNTRKPIWTESHKQLVLLIRRQNPTYGKAKIAVILTRDHNLKISESTVGRIIKHLMQKGLIQTSLSAPRKKRTRRFLKHAKPWTYSLKPNKPGQMVQIDHMKVCKNNLEAKHFQAWTPIGRFIYANVFTSANSTTAKRFLKELIAAAPFKITSIQVDGGAEFMKEFEQACQNLNIQLYVLPPRRPQWNGGVERGNRIFREEFYSRKELTSNSIGDLKAELKKALLKYNTYRPHQALNGDTPLNYTLNILKKAA